MEIEPIVSSNDEHPVPGADGIEATEVQHHSDQCFHREP
jgi:hypothetical protein